MTTTPKMTELRDDLRMVLDDGPRHAYLLRRGDEIVIVDTGIAGQADAITAALGDWGLGRDALTHVLITHWHPDHAGSVAALSTWPHARIWAHRVDAPIIRGDQAGAFPHLSHAEEGLYSQISGTVPDAPPSRVDRELNDDEVLTEIGARVLSVPGHTERSIALHSRPGVAHRGRRDREPGLRHRRPVQPGPGEGPLLVSALRRHRREHRLLRTRPTTARSRHPQAARGRRRGRGPRPKA